MYAVLDTNVIVSALLVKNSTPSFILRHALVGNIIPVTNKEIIMEYIEVLNRKKFSFPREQEKDVVEGLIDRAVYINDIELKFKLSDPKDAVFYEVAVENMKQYDTFIITGNKKHFTDDDFVITPREALGVINVI